MGRKLYYIDSYGKVHRDKKAEKAQIPSGMSPVKIVLWVLIAMAILMVLSSVR